MTVSFFSYTLLIQILSLLYLAILNLVINKRRTRKLISFYTILINLVLNTILFILSVFNGIVEENSIFELSIGTLLFVDIIYIFGLLLSIFSRIESDEYESEKISDCIILLIISSLIGSILTMNLVSFISCFLVVNLLIGCIFFIAEHKKELNLVKFYFIGFIFTVTCLVLSSVVIFIETRTVLLYEINQIEFSNTINIFVSFLMILGIGIPFGMFPFFIYHLRKFFQNTSFTYLFLYSMFNYISAFLLLRILHIFTFSLVFNGFIIFFLSSLGLIISLFYSITELFTSFDGSTFSIKKLFGYSTVSDFNVFLLLSSILALINLEDNPFYFEGVIFFMLIIMFNKFLILYTFYPLILETYDDNLKILGNFGTKYKFFGLILFLSGILLIFPLSLSGTFNLLNIYTLNELRINSLLRLIATLTFSLFIIYLFVNLIFISIIYTRIYFNNKAEYTERENIKRISLYHLLPIPVLFSFILTYIVLFFVGNNFIFELFKEFFIISNL